MDELLNEVVESYNDYIKNIPPGCLLIANNFREYLIADALKNITDFSEGINWLTEVNNLFFINNIKVVLDTQKLQIFLKEINRGLEKQDYILVADIFEYELCPFFEGCNEVIV